MVCLTDQPIDRTSVLAETSLRDAGALVIFEGSVRDNSNGREVIRLEYEAFAELALKEMRRIEDEAGARWPLGFVAIVHRVGSLAPGETSVLIAVRSGHRGEAFEACRFIIDTLKARVPIWKKEHYRDGSAWIGGHP